ncbi:non-specific lipid transfer protein GPI-anchored 16-like [Corylus avellana]|uniref:non-specific lipid transfer protein GPI-anchored 16-like n=1 Tax=Corylus avellana TaxID=13451 RepID=UPI001E20C7F3|nr:non-specific lipid transfer protein GPI-anchored 16-like [Corylus avellana]
MDTAILATLLLISAISVNGQISTPCTTSMLSSFTPCFNFITGSTNNGSTPTTGCCASLQTLMSTSVDCACLLITANVPVQLPINRTLALSLPRACNMASVSAQCKASGSPLPSPGPISFGPAQPPPSIAASPFSPRASKAEALAPAPESETPASPPVEAEAPTTTSTPAKRPVLTPSTSAPSSVYPAPLLLLLLGAMIFKSF